MKPETQTIKKRQAVQKRELIEKLKQTPIIQVACQKLGIGRTSYYRWRQADKKFAKQADEAIRDGILLVNDLAESQLISAIKDKNMTAIIFYLKTHHKSYGDKLEINGKLEHSKIELSKEQKRTIRKALKLASLR